ncbi:Zinc finger, CCCH-type [Plasmopara halstedii]|uniref:Zinc finger, CCCH-type n=1 Tax=Plasmopara halstedii TaxID=4781 RepID=A0A0P1A915_PLAHL|nr:Zinc finger, CCCH-type [Plasmopara halstedii]CEG37188.1 Zinc finger, CCCH-type [Plasmopara halstedii]|eukprot:XP_024573557.1 Zinc finger, CCCH-type [Plasmopara halstedii]
MVWTNFAELREQVATSKALTCDIIVKGQLMHRRCISRKCSFFDMASVLTNSDGERDWLEVILKVIDDELSVDRIDTIRYQIKVGDTINVRGFMERLTNGTLLLHARDIIVDRAWKDEFPEVTFVPLLTALMNKRLLNDEDKQGDGVENDARSGTQKSVVRAIGEQMHCKFWINSKTCQYGDSCKFVHVSDADIKTVRAKWIKERLHSKRSRAHIIEDPLDPHGKTGKQQRAQVFVDWLVKIFGMKFLASGKGVLDIAGGRGSVSFELWNKRGLPCTLIEPRPMKLSKQQHNYLKLKHKQSGGANASANETLVPQVAAFFNENSFLENMENLQLIEQASLLLGMHPDQATDSILDVAIKFNKPFAVVPCCVFGQNFPDRRLVDGSKVLSYEHLVEYLTAKHPDIEKAFLPFDGKNLVLYRRPYLTE